MNVNHTRRISFAAVAAALLAPAAVDAAIIVNNDITDANPSAANPFSAGQVVAADLTASGIGRGSGATANAGGNRYNAANWSTSGLDPNDYFDWTIAATAGHAVDFTSLAGNWQRSSTGPNTYALRSSLDGFASDLATGSITGSGTVAAFTLDLSASSLDAVEGPITFRLYAWGGTAATGTFSVNDYAFDGAAITAAAVPEPAAISLVGIGAAALLARRRRRRA